MPEPTRWSEDLKAIDAQLGQVPLPDGLEHRIMAAARGGGAVIEAPRRRFIGVAVAFAAGVLLTLAWARYRAAPEPAVEVTQQRDDQDPRDGVDPGPETPPTVVTPGPGLTITSADCSWQRDGEQLLLASGCRLRVAEPALELEAWAPTRVAPIAGGLAMLSGVASFAVEHRSDPASPARIGVSGGTIEILGTRFVIEQRESGGHVDLISGAIAFRDLDGALASVEAGRRHHWRTPAIEPDEPTPTRPRTELDETDDTRARELAEVLDEVARLRHAGAYAEAIARLDALRERDYPARTREVVSYERATLVERADTPAAACASWAAHRRRFPDGRYDADIERRLDALDCEASE